MINQIIEITKDEYDNRIKVYELYLKIKEEINGKKIIIEKNEYEELIFRTEISTILNYIKESIPILINKKIEESQIKSFKEKGKKNNINEINIYENHLRKLENQLRYYIKQILIYKIQKDSFEKTLRNYMEMEIEFEELKEKLKYDEGEFLNNDRKENEIEILRRENSNLKNAINKIEDEKKLIELKRENDQKSILNLKNQIEKLEKKIYKLEKEKNNYNSNQNNINININNNGKTSSKWIIKRDNNDNNTIQNKNHYEHRTSNLHLIDNAVFASTYYKILNNLSHKSTLSPNKISRHYHKTNSLNNINDDKNYSLNSNNNYNKISFVSNRKFPINRDINKQTISAFSRIYINNSKCYKSGNRSNNTIRNKSAENY